MNNISNRYLYTLIALPLLMGISYAMGVDKGTERERERMEHLAVAAGAGTYTKGDQFIWTQVPLSMQLDPQEVR